MKTLIFLAILCIAYYSFVFITGLKLAGKIKKEQEQRQEVMSEVLKESGIFDIYNINGKDIK